MAVGSSDPPPTWLALSQGLHLCCWTRVDAVAASSCPWLHFGSGCHMSLHMPDAVGVAPKVLGPLARFYLPVTEPAGAASRHPSREGRGQLVLLPVWGAFFFFLFWSPHGKWSSQARDQIQAPVTTYATAVVKDRTCVPLLHRGCRPLCHSGNSQEAFWWPQGPVSPCPPAHGRPLGLLSRTGRFSDCLSLCGHITTVPSTAASPACHSGSPSANLRSQLWDMPTVEWLTRQHSGGSVS